MHAEIHTSADPIYLCTIWTAGVITEVASKVVCTADVTGDPGKVSVSDGSLANRSGKGKGVTDSGLPAVVWPLPDR